MCIYACCGPGPRTELPWNYFVHCGPRTTMSCVFIAAVVCLNHPGPRTELSWNYFVHCGPGTMMSCVFIADVVLGLRWHVCFEPLWSYD